MRVGGAARRGRLQNDRVGECRKAFEQELTSPGGDPVLAALHLAAEDDAVNTKSTVPLPTAAFSKRLDNLVDQLCNRIDAGNPDLCTPEAALSYLRDTLFGPMRFRVAQKKLELYSPYRIYMHKVLTQRCGTPEALAVLLAAFLQRAQQRGVVPEFQCELGVPATPGQLPAVRPLGTSAPVEDVRCASRRCCQGLRIVPSAFVGSGGGPVIQAVCGSASRQTFAPRECVG